MVDFNDNPCFYMLCWLWLFPKILPLCEYWCVGEVLCVNLFMGVSFFAEVFAWDYENEGWEDFVASSLFECDFLWSGKEFLHFVISKWYPIESSSLNLGLIHISCRLLIHQHALLTLVRNAVIQVNGKGNSFLGFQRLSMRWGLFWPIWPIKICFIFCTTASSTMRRLLFSSHFICFS